MSRNVLLIVCLGLGASFLAIATHIHRPASQPLEAAVSGTVESSPVTVISPVAKGVPVQSEQASAVALAPSLTKPVLEQAEQDANALTVSEVAITNAAVVSDTNTVEDKFQALRDLTAWAARDPEAALAAAVKLPEGDERNQALAAVCSGLAQTDPAEAVKLAQSLQLDKQSSAIMEDLVQQWASTDLASSLAWAENQPAGAPRDELTTRVAFIMSQSDPSDAATLVMNQIPPGPAQDEAIMTVLHQWADQNFTAAATWAKGSVVGPLQTRVFNELKGMLDYRQALAQR